MSALEIRDRDVVPPGQLVVANVVDVMASLDIKIPPSWMGIIGAHAKALFEGGFAVDEITAAALVAVRRGKPQLTQSIAGDIALAAAGQMMSNTEYESYLSAHNAVNKVSLLDTARARRQIGRAA